MGYVSQQAGPVPQPSQPGASTQDVCEQLASFASSGIIPSSQSVQIFIPLAVQLIRFSMIKLQFKQICKVMKLQGG